MKITKIDNPKIESHNTKGTYNSYGYLANAIRFDESKVIEKNYPITEAIDWEVERDKLGGIIVFSTDVNAVEMSENKFINFIKQKLATLSNRFTYNKKLDRLANKDENIYAWTIGRYLHGRYKAKNGVVFDENSLSVELVSVDDDTIIKFAEEICREFKQETVLVKLYSDNRIIFVNGN